MFKAPQAPALPAITAPPANPPMFGETKPNAKPKPKSMQTTFLGSTTTPSPGQTGTATLLGGS